jgi:hypothetical protein
MQRNNQLLFTQNHESTLYPPTTVPWPLMTSVCYCCAKERYLNDNSFRLANTAFAINQSSIFFHFHFILQTDITGLVCLSIIYKFQIFQQRQIMLMEDLYSIVHGVLFLASSYNEGSGAIALMK